MFICIIYLCNYLIIIFTYCSVALPTRLRIARESFLVYSTSSTFYTLLGGIGAALDGGVVYGVAINLDGGVSAGGEGSRG